jgi:diguanylate cyclase (GGDEF)-like protein
MLDLDHFKPINDTAGHAAGDAMLVAVAQAIASRVRATDVVVRLGGDEFALLLTRCTHERAVSVAEKVREAITDLALTWEAHTLRVGASLGVCELADSHESPAQWLAQADAACYEAKRAGRGTVRLARKSLRVVAGGS